MALIATRYAFRSLTRHARRTALSVVGIGIGCSLVMVMESFNRGRDELFARMGAYSGAGHLRIVPAEWRQRRDPRLRLADWERDARAARAVSGVAAVTVRARAQALLALGTHVTAVELVGVDPGTEPKTNRFVQRVQQGRYLRGGERGGLVVGQVIADRLQADLDDEILASIVGEGGNVQSGLFRIVGIVRSGSDDIDGTVSQVTLPDLQELTGRPGAGEVTLMVDDWRATEAIRARLAPGLAPGDDVLTWGELSPEFKGHQEQDKALMRVISAFSLLIVLLGVASAQLAAVLERQREFAVLAALGMSGARMVRLVFVEALVIGLGGAAVGLTIGLPIVWRFARAGLDLRGYMGQTFEFSGAIVEPVIYGDFGPWIAGTVLAAAFGATLLASLYPAWFALRTDPAVALRGAP